MTETVEMATSNNVWLKRYYTVRALFSTLWVAAAFMIGKASPSVGLGLIVAYPAWDSLANYIDAWRNGGLRANPPQFLNMIVSAIVTLAVAAASTRGFHAIIAVVGIWAALSGLLQLSTAVRRWRSAGAQWPMILSGAQSALAGAFFVQRSANVNISLGAVDVAPYAAFGALYFGISAAILFFKRE